MGSWVLTGGVQRGASLAVPGENNRLTIHVFIGIFISAYVVTYVADAQTTIHTSMTLMASAFYLAFGGGLLAADKLAQPGRALSAPLGLSAACCPGLSMVT